MRILVIGGHGKVARLLHPLLAARGHDVTAVIRNADHAADVDGDGARPLVADVESLDTDGIAELLRGHDAVVWSAGAGGGDPRRTDAVDRDAAIRSMDAAAAAGVNRYVMVSYFGAGPDHGVPEGDPFFTYAAAKSAADAHLEGTDLAWTILRPSRLTDDAATGAIETSRTGATKGSVPRGDVARVVAETLERPGLGGSVIEFNTGPTPIADELDATPTTR
ncbi:SDR family oxidoreductase [Oryzobacter terrae]|uniref:SDR family oxidoreductase n=1 Tax=Oryzobacter terrae TaxID=1620385 RepID=UPI00366CB192